MHEKNLKRWGLIKAKMLKLQFRCWRKFNLNFKIKYRIDSRKIETVVSNKSIIDKPEIEMKISHFRLEVIEN